MPNSGFFMHKTKPEAIKEAVWLEEQCLRRQGGYDLDRTNLPSTVKWLAKGTVFKLGTDGKAKVVKTALVTEKAASGATTLKIASGSLYQVGDTVAGKAITAISSADGVDTLTVEALSKAIDKDTVVTDYDSKDTVLGFSYDTLDLRIADASIPVTPTLQVMEVEEDTLPYPINDDIKAGIRTNGIALFKIQ
jgi:hypothetical protein